MIRKIVRSFLHRFNYEIIKADWKDPDKFKIPSDIENTDLFDTPKGKYYLPGFLKADTVASVIRRGELFDENIINLAAKYLQKGEAALDVGANYGQMSVQFAALVGPAGKVYSFEAEPFVYSVLCNNIKANNCNNITPVFGAVHFENDMELVFPEPDFKQFTTYGSYGLNMKATEGRKVKTLTIDSLNIPEKIGFMKIDVQGADLFAMQGARNTIIKNRMPIVFEFEQQFQDDFDTSFQDYVDFVQSIDYKFAATVDDINFLIVPADKAI